MKIKIIESSFESDGNHMSKVAWCNSRPKEKMEELYGKMVRSLDLPVNEFCSASMFVESTILEREIIVSMRNHVMWAQTSRVQNILEFEYPDWIDDTEVFERVRDRMITASGVSRQDDFRMELPIMSTTKYSIRMSARDIAHLRNYAVHLLESGNFNHLLEMLESFIYEFDAVLVHLGFEIDAIEKYKTPEILKSIKCNSSGHIGGTITISARISISLRAQLVRHRSILIRDNLRSMMMDPGIVYSSIGDKMFVQISGFEEDMIDILRKRSCWIAQYNLWAPILNEISTIIEADSAGLPCHDGECPYEKDAELRLEGKDPNAPCPKHAILNNLSINSLQREKMITQAKDDDRPVFWKDIISIVK